MSESSLQAKPNLSNALPSRRISFRWLYVLVFFLAIIEYAIACGCRVLGDNLESVLSVALFLIGFVAYRFRSHKGAILVLWATLMFSVARFLIWRVCISLNLNTPANAA